MRQTGHLLRIRSALREKKIYIESPTSHKWKETGRTKAHHSTSVYHYHTTVGQDPVRSESKVFLLRATSIIIIFQIHLTKTYAATLRTLSILQISI